MTEIREALNGAFEQAGGGDSPPPESNTGTPVEALGVDETPPPGELAAPPDEAPAAPPTAPKPPLGVKVVPPPGAKPTPATPPSTAQQATTPPAEAPKPATPTVKPPQSWRPEVREKWAGLPAEVQAEVARREREVATALQESATARKSWESFRETVAPYEALIRAEGSEPLRAVGSLLQTAAALRTAPPAHKARLVASLIQQYAVPVDALDAALSGQAPPAEAAQAPTLDPEALLRQAEQRVFQRLQSQHQQTVLEKARQETDAFVNSGEAEFIDDVREIMSNLLDSASRSGIPLTLKDAYNRACSIHPEVSKVLEQRRDAQRATASQAQAQKARAAAASVRSQPAAPPAAAAPTDIRSLLERGFSRSSGR